MAFRAVDLFAGGGGLTVGLKKAGFKVAAAIEMEEHACATYLANHSEVRLFRRDIRDVSGDELRRWLGNNQVDLLAACPPCQGYTSLNKTGSEDPRNKLIFEITRLAAELQPEAIMMENVPGLTSRGRVLFDQLKSDLKNLGYKFDDSCAVLEVADYGVPQRRRRLVLLAGRGFEIQLPERTHSAGGRNGLKRWKSVWDTIGERNDLGDPLTLPEAKKQGDLNRSKWHTVRALSPQNVARIKAAVPGKSWTSIPEHLRPDCHRGGYEGFTNVYGRMEWDQPSPTITAGCTTFSKGRFGHPKAHRTISVREAALLQTFPEDYVFDVPYMDRVCTVIGNALPCDFAESIAKQCHAALSARSTI